VRSVLFLRPTLDWCAVEQRENGLRAAFARDGRNVEVKTVLVPSEGFDDVQRIVNESLANRAPDAIVAATDSMAGAALKACEAHGLNVPRDIRITGFNGFDVWRYTRPTLPTVMSPAYDMGRCAASS
jgi:LacI family transcriptional regulator